MGSKTNDAKFKSMSRRELLKLTPVLALGAFAIPKLQGSPAQDWVGIQRLGVGKIVSRGAHGPDVRGCGRNAL